MKKILFVNACVRPESRTAVLARHLLQMLEGDIEELRLGEEDIRPLDLEMLEKRNRLVEEADYSDDMLRYARQFSEADLIVMAAPYWDLSFPALVKAYIEAVTVQGVTFRYTEKGIPEGLCKAEKMIYVTTAGGFIGDYNMGFDYVDTMCRGLYGIKDTVCHKAEKLDIIGEDVDAIIAEAEKELDSIYGDR